MADVSLLVLIPTRNRADLAKRALQALENPALREELMDHLRARGHGARLAMLGLRETVKRVGRKAETAVKRVFRPDRLPLSQLAFPDIDAALSYDRAHPTPRVLGSAHLRIWRSKPVADS